MSQKFGFRVTAEDGAARAGNLDTAHGSVATPAFMPVGTAGTVKAMTAAGLAETGSEIVLANAYHLMLRPGAERIARLGGVRRFMNWNGPVLTDSGGFQVMSLATLGSVDESGVSFRSHIDGTPHQLTPERAVSVQDLLDSTITMVLDACTPYPVPEDRAAESMRLSMRWARRSRDSFRPRPGHALFGIVQGGVFTDLRVESASYLRDLEFDGHALGGLAVGEGQAAMLRVIETTVSELAADRPRYAMGVGRPDDIVAAVQRGIDLFDCVLPTRSGRTGQAFTAGGTVNLRNARHADDPRPLDGDCPCPACRGHGRAYLHHLVKSHEILGAVLLTWHNLHFYQNLMAELRRAIAKREFAAYSARFIADWAAGNIEPH